MADGLQLSCGRGTCWRGAVARAPVRRFRWGPAGVALAGRGVGVVARAPEAGTCGGIPQETGERAALWHEIGAFWGLLRASASENPRSRKAAGADGRAIHATAPLARQKSGKFGQKLKRERGAPCVKRVSGAGSAPASPRRRLRRACVHSAAIRTRRARRCAPNAASRCPCRPGSRARGVAEGCAPPCG